MLRERDLPTRYADRDLNVDHGGRFGFRSRGLWLVVLLALTWAPAPLSEVAAILAAVVLPATKWQRVVRGRFEAASSSFVAGLLVSMAATSIVGLVAVYVRVPVRHYTAALTALVLYAIPGALGRRTEREEETFLQEPSPKVPAHLVRRKSRRLSHGLSVVSVTAGLVLEIVSNHLAATNAGLRSTHYLLFWLGLGLVLYPLLSAATSRDSSVRVRTASIGGLALAVYFPAFLRSPTQPLMYDDFGHVEAVGQILATGRLFEPNPVVPFASYYPGLHTLVLPLQLLSGTSTWSVAVPLLAMFHVISLYGIFELALAVGAAPSGAGLAAAVYAASPSFAWFDSQFAYESYAVPLVIWAIVFGLRMARRRLDWTNALCLGVIGLACVVTHHVSSYVLIAVIGMIALTVRPVGLHWKRSTTRRASQHLGLLILALGLAAVAVLWIAALQIPILSYLDPYPIAGFDTVRHLLGGSRGTPAAPAGSYLSAQPSTQHLFSGGLLPTYEEAAAFLIQPCLFAVYVFCVVQDRHGLRDNPWFAVLGAAYFASLPFALSGTGAQGAHRSWTFSWIGLAIVFGYRGMESRRLSSYNRALHGVPARRTSFAAVPIVLLVLLMGAWGSTVDDYQMFPGKFLINSDGRNVSTELRVAAEWFRAHEGPNREIATTQRTLAIFGAYAEAQSPPGFPTWDLFYPTTCSSGLLHLAAASKVQFVVVDSRLSTEKATLGPYFSVFEPKAPSNPLPMASTQKFNQCEWTVKIYQSKHISIYRVT